MAEQSVAADSGGREGGSDASRPSEVVEPLITVPFRPDFHRAAEFRCVKSERVANFFTAEWPRFASRGYCRVLVYPDPGDQARILGYYTLSPTELRPEDLTGTQRRNVIGGLPVPMMLIGFMGRDDGAEAGVGGMLLIDAARRVHRSTDTNAWALKLDAEGGPVDNPKLFDWYKSMGFTPRKDETGVETKTMYCPIRRLLPELQRRG
jgi:hypothetical protein